MRLEHVALQVAEPRALADWYAQHLGFTIARRQDDSPFGQFIMSGDGRVMIELYSQPHLSVPDYAKTPMGTLHLAFVSSDPELDRDRLVQAGCRVESEEGSDALGEDRIVNLRDPWGLPMQLVRRAMPMLRG